MPGSFHGRRSEGTRVSTLFAGCPRGLCHFHVQSIGASASTHDTPEGSLQRYLQGGALLVVYLPLPAATAVGSGIGATRGMTSSPVARRIPASSNVSRATSPSASPSRSRPS